jgi:hypothetical protein
MQKDPDALHWRHHYGHRPMTSALGGFLSHVGVEKAWG